MKFKLTLLKTIVSVLGGILTNYYLTTRIHIYCIKAPCPQPTWLDYAFTSKILLTSIIAIVLIYIIWSFFQKKN